jgi:virginiamycin A acetyltransferase
MKVLKRIYRIFKYTRFVFAKEVGKKNKFAYGCEIYEKSKLGSNNYIGKNSIISYAVIGNYCSIASNVVIGPANHSMSFLTTSNKISSRIIDFNLFQKPAIIGNDVWIGANSVILQGVKVGNGAVIGANSVVTHDIEPYSINVGAPSRKIKMRFETKTIKKLETSQWYNKRLRKAIEILSVIYEEK